jgi:hypothetical protein
MTTIQKPLDTPIELVVWSTLEIAHDKATSAAVNSCGVVSLVFAVEVDARRFSLVGKVPGAAVEATAPVPPGRPTVRAGPGGQLHSTFEGLNRREGCVGYFVLSPPLRLIAGTPRADGGFVWSAIEIDHRRRATDGYSLGNRCCERCAVPLALSRVKAVPGVKLCPDCQLQIERGGRNGNP